MPDLNHPIEVYLDMGCIDDFKCDYEGFEVSCKSTISSVVETLNYIQNNSGCSNFATYEPLKNCIDSCPEECVEMFSCSAYAQPPALPFPPSAPPFENMYYKDIIYEFIHERSTIDVRPGVKEMKIKYSICKCYR